VSFVDVIIEQIWLPMVLAEIKIPFNPVRDAVRQIQEVCSCGCKVTIPGIMLSILLLFSDSKADRIYSQESKLFTSQELVLHPGRIR
jgi:hypothetical protein